MTLHATCIFFTVMTDLILKLYVCVIMCKNSKCAELWSLTWIKQFSSKNFTQWTLYMFWPQVVKLVLFTSQQQIIGVSNDYCHSELEIFGFHSSDLQCFLNRNPFSKILVGLHQSVVVQMMKMMRKTFFPIPKDDHRKYLFYWKKSINTLVLHKLKTKILKKLSETTLMPNGVQSYIIKRLIVLINELCH